MEDFVIFCENNVKLLKKRLKKEKNNEKTNIVVFCGGKSFEHDISILTAQTILNAVPNKYNVNLLYQSLDGNFYLSPKDSKANDIKNLKDLLKVNLKINTPYLYNEKNKKLFKVDLVINCGHGQNCEDGTITHLFNLCNIISTNACSTSQALTLDKEYMKDIFFVNNFLTSNYVVMKKDGIDLDKVLEQLEFPMILKPANLGSSIGVCVCENMQELQNAVEFAFKFDDKIIFEEYLTDIIEVNCACRNIDGVITASKCELPTKKEKYLSFDDKYKSNNKGKRSKLEMTTLFCQTEENEIVEKEIPINEINSLTKLPNNIIDEIKSLTVKLYDKFDCDGVIRIDYLVKGDLIYVNEINSIPGSLAYYLFNEDIETFVDKLILSTIRKQKEKINKNYYFETNILC